MDRLAKSARDLEWIVRNVVARSSAARDVHIEIVPGSEQTRMTTWRARLHPPLPPASAEHAKIDGQLAVLQSLYDLKH